MQHSKGHRMFVGDTVDTKIWHEPQYPEAWDFCAVLY